MKKESEMRTTVIVTGAASGIGQAVCMALLHMGQYFVVGIDKDPISLSGAVDSFCTIEGDLIEDDLHVLRLLHTTLLECPRVSGLVNAAGISDRDFDKSMALNVKAPMALFDYVIDNRFNKDGDKHEWFSVVNVGSPEGTVGANKPEYSASKAAVHGLSMAWARGYGEVGVRANTILPGACITGMTSDWSVEKRHAVAQGTFRKFMHQPKEIADVIAFLISDQSSAISGSQIDCTFGGMFRA